MEDGQISLGGAGERMRVDPDEPCREPAAARRAPTVALTAVGDGGVWRLDLFD
jgi:hypothetical protein